MISKIQNTNNNISMQAKCRLFLRKYSTHTPAPRPYKEFEFQPELQEKSPVKKFLDYIVENIINIKR